MRVPPSMGRTCLLVFTGRLPPLVLGLLFGGATRPGSPKSVATSTPSEDLP
jgi:hypothetical protein